jgi:hypothetical protein
MVTDEGVSMKNLFVVLLFSNLAVAAIPSDLVDDPNADRLVPAIKKTFTWSAGSVSEAREKALSILDRASIGTLDDKRHLVYEKMEYSLSRVKLNIPPEGEDLEHCVQTPEQKEKGVGVLAFVNTRNRGVIHVCAVTSDMSNLKYVAQVLVHETAHTIGIDDECVATKTEVSAMRDSGVGLVFKNGYFEECGFN